MIVRIKQEPAYPEFWRVEVSLFGLFWRSIKVCNSKEEAVKVATAVKHPIIEEIQ